MASVRCNGPEIVNGTFYHEGHTGTGTGKQEGIIKLP